VRRRRLRKPAVSFPSEEIRELEDTRIHIQQIEPIERLLYSDAWSVRDNCTFFASFRLTLSMRIPQSRTPRPSSLVPGETANVCLPRVVLHGHDLRSYISRNWHGRGRDSWRGVAAFTTESRGKWGCEIGKQDQLDARNRSSKTEARPVCSLKVELPLAWRHCSTVNAKRDKITNFD